jgi:hypothetical protein
VLIPPVIEGKICEKRIFQTVFHPKEIVSKPVAQDFGAISANLSAPAYVANMPISVKSEKTQEEKKVRH